MKLKCMCRPIVNDDMFLNKCDYVYTTLAFFVALVWGFIGDKISIRTALMVSIVLDSIIKAMSFFLTSEVEILFLLIGIGITDKALTTLMGPALI